jgi:hypothetical protein
MRWWGGLAFIISENDNRSITVLARYPQHDFSSDEKTKVFAWKYVGGIFGLIKGFYKGLQYVKAQKKKILQALLYAYYFAGDWKKTDRVIDLDFSNRPCLTAELYPNENNGRIILCGTHPEYMIWWDGHIEEVSEDSDHCIANGFHQWKDISLRSTDGMDELTHTWWLVRRLVSWAAKIPDDQLPPIEIDHGNNTRESLIHEVFWDGTLEKKLKYI